MILTITISAAWPRVRGPGDGGGGGRLDGPGGGADGAPQLPPGAGVPHHDRPAHRQAEARDAGGCGRGHGIWPRDKQQVQNQECPRSGKIVTPNLCSLSK